MKNTKFIDEIKTRGNFWFIYNIDQELYGKLYSAEKESRINVRSCGKLTREILEAIVSRVINHYKITKYFGRQDNVYTKIRSLRNEKFLRDAGYLGPDEKVIEKPILPNIGKVKATFENGMSRTIDYYTFLRKLANACSHDESDVEPEDVKVNYDHILKALKGYHSLLRKLYRKRISNDTPAFMEEYMPIDIYYIEESYIPNDSDRTKCMREFVGYEINAKGEKTFYAVLRLYNKADINEQFLLRNTDAFVEASKFSISSVPVGMTRMRELIPYQNHTSPFYIIAYIFNREPWRLDQGILKNMDMAKRVKVCQRIADCFYNLHKSEVPIYHRMLSNESVYVCDLGREWVPFVIKLDFAKIVSKDDFATIFEDAMKAKKKVQKLQQLKYLAPEWDTTKDTSEANWDKMDIYSLGVLFGDILGGKIGTSLVDLDELEDLGLSEDLVDLIDMMTGDLPGERPDIEEVQIIIEEEARHWR